MTDLFSEEDNRRTLFPIKHPKLWEIYKKHEAAIWTAEEIDLGKDTNDWNKLNDNEQHFIKYVLAFFAESDAIVADNLAERFYNEVKIREARFFYGFQIAMENIHGETYSLLIDTYIKDEKEKHTLLNAINNIPCVQKKAEWALKWSSDQQSDFATRLVSFAIVEGIFFSGSFCAIFWLKKRGLMPGLTFSNELISRDEALHTKFAVILYNNYIVDKLSQSQIYQIMEEAVKCEKEFITEALPCNLIGMNNELMAQYIEFVADRLLVQLRYEKKWNTANPFDFMEMISMTGKTNFFEKRVGEYAKAGVGLSMDQMKFGLDEEF